MGCNCKKINRFADAYGVKEEESLFGKINRLFYRTILFVITILLSIVVIPCVIFVAIYRIFWGKDNKITLPKFMRKYME